MYIFDEYRHTCDLAVSLSLIVLSPDRQWPMSQASTSSLSRVQSCLTWWVTQLQEHDVVGLLCTVVLHSCVDSCQYTVQPTDTHWLTFNCISLLLVLRQSASSSLFSWFSWSPLSFSYSLNTLTHKYCKRLSLLSLLMMSLLMMSLLTLASANCTHW